MFSHFCTRYMRFYLTKVKIHVRFLHITFFMAGLTHDILLTFKTRLKRFFLDVLRILYKVEMKYKTYIHYAYNCIVIPKLK